MSTLPWAHADLHRRTIAPIVGRKGRRRCCCGCGKMSTHTGRANGIAMTAGCEWFVRIWVRDGTAAIVRRSQARRRFA